MADMTETNELLAEILHQLSSLRTELSDFTGTVVLHNVDDIYSAMQGLETKLDEVADRITGAVGGIGGSTLDEICSAVDSVTSTIEINSD